MLEYARMPRRNLDVTRKLTIPNDIESKWFRSWSHGRTTCGTGSGRSGWTESGRWRWVQSSRTSRALYIAIPARRRISGRTTAIAAIGPPSTKTIHSNNNRHCCETNHCSDNEAQGWVEDSGAFPPLYMSGRDSFSEVLIIHPIPLRLRIHDSLRFIRKVRRGRHVGLRLGNVPSLWLSHLLLSCLFRANRRPASFCAHAFSRQREFPVNHDKKARENWRARIELCHDTF